MPYPENAYETFENKKEKEQCTMRSSLGFHTMSLVLAIDENEFLLLMEDFRKYSEQTGLIRIYKENDDCHITYHREDKGIRWRIRQCDYYYTLSLRLVEVKINPKILSGIHDYITAATYADMETAITAFNRISEQISPILKDFSHYHIQRLDYCINFDLKELTGGCGTELVMDLLKRSDIPTHYEEGMKYDKTSHRMKSLPGSFYLINQSNNINCYSKQFDLQQRAEHWGDSITQQSLDAANNIIRFEVQCKYRKMYALSKKEKNAGNRKCNLYQVLLTQEACMDKIEYYYHKIIGRGDWYTLPGCNTDHPKSALS